MWGTGALTGFQSNHEERGTGAWVARGHGAPPCGKDRRYSVPHQPAYVQNKTAARERISKPDSSLWDRFQKLWESDTKEGPEGENARALFKARGERAKSRSIQTRAMTDSEDTISGTER